MKDLSPTLKHATLWLLIGTVVFLAFQAWQARARRPQLTLAGGAIEIRRSADGHFHWPGHIARPGAQGEGVDFLVDTGATRTALPEPLARRLGLMPEAAVRSSTAGGTVQGWAARADLDLAGGVRAARLPVTVLPALGAPLLGMDVLGKLRFIQSDGVLRLEPAR